MSTDATPKPSAVEGIKVVTLGASKVACGVTGPRGNNNPSTDRASVSPIPFLRAMKAAGAKGFDAYAHHPYYGRTSETPSTKPPPGIHGNAPTAVTLGNLGSLITEVNRLYGKKRIWLTEYGYQTSPPDLIFGVSWQKKYSEPAAVVDLWSSMAPPRQEPTPKPAPRIEPQPKPPAPAPKPEVKPIPKPDIALKEKLEKEERTENAHRGRP